MSVTWEGETSSQTLAHLKFEQSSTQSFLSAPGSEMYPPLFGGSPAPSTLNPLDVMTPKSYGDDQRPDYSGMSASPEPTSAEKKPAKKRKSWGQVLPEPKTNLPPRKRAKTEDEKEQRRVERVLRNRRAAQSSRERKRQEVEQLEKKNQELLAFVEQIQKQNLALRQENHQLRISSGVAPKSSSSFDALLPAPVTFSSELFSSQSGHNADLSSPAASSSLQSLLSPPSQFNSQQTVNPASLSPALSPVAEGDESDDEHGPVTPGAVLSSAPVISEKAFPDAMRHPAAMLCDLQCPSAEAPQSWLAASKPNPALTLILSLQVLLASASTALTFCRRPLTQITFSMRAGFSIPPTRLLLKTIILLVTTPKTFFQSTTTATATPPSTTMSTSTTSSTTTSPPMSSCSNSPCPTTSPVSTRPSQTLRLRTLRKILSCSPNCARPLSDATVEVLRLVQSKRHQVAGVTGAGASTTSVGDWAGPEQQLHDGEDTPWFSGVPLPSEAVLITLLWVIRVEERKLIHRRRDLDASARESEGLGVSTSWHQPNIFLKVADKAGQARRTMGSDGVEQSSAPLA